MKKAAKQAKSPSPESPAIRDKKSGRYLPGQSGNIFGRPRTAHISEALRQKLDSVADDGRTYAQVISDRLVSTAAFSKRDSQATQAASEIADRIEGKPNQSIRVEQSLDEETIKRISELAAKLLPEDQQPFASAFVAFPAFQPPTQEQKVLPDVSQTTLLDAASARD